MAASDNYRFDLVGTEQAPFVGYISSEDPTRVSPQAMVRGSQNVILRDNGNIVNRPGLRRYDPADNTDDPVVSSFDWSDMNGNTLLIRVLASGKLQFYRTNTETWVTLDTYTGTDFSFAKWWSQENAKELLVMSHGTSDLLMWSGGIVSDTGPYQDNAVAITGATNVSSLSLPTVGVNNDEILTSVVDGANNAARRAVIIINENPSGNSQFVQLVIGGLAPAVSATATIQFVETLSTPLDTNFAQVLIGSSIEETTINLSALLNNPSGNTATYLGFTDANTITAVGYLGYDIVPTLMTADGSNWTENGFIRDGTLVVGTDEYTYTLVVADYLVNISGEVPEGSVAFQAVVVNANTPDEDFTNDFILCLNNQIITCSFTSRVVYISSNQDAIGSTGYSDFVNGGDLIPGDPDFVVLDEFPKGGTTRGNSAYIGAGNSSWYEVTPNVSVPIAFQNVSGSESYVITEVKKFAGAGLSAPLGPNFVATVGEDIVYLAQDHQLRTLGFYRNINQQKSPALSLPVRQELIEEDFTGGQLRTIDEYTYITAPISGKTYLYEIKDDVDRVGNIVSKRNWQPPQIWNISRLSIVNGIVHGYSNETPQLYQLWDTGIWHDETSEEDEFSPYISILRLAYRQFGERDDLGSFDKVYYEGYILPNSDLRSNVYYDYRGATRLSEKVLSSNELNPVLFGNTGVTLIGGDTIGNTTIGGGLRDFNYGPLPKFRVITNVQVDNCFEYQIELISEALDSRWELLATGVNADKATQSPVQLVLTQ